MAEKTDAVSAQPRTERTPLGRVVVPIRFGDQVVTSLLFNHDANPVHHKPDHALQWMLGLFSSASFGGDGNLAQATPEERTYTLGSMLLLRPDVVVMPGAVMAAIAYERFVPPGEVTVSITTTFTYPLLVPTKGEVLVTLEGYELRSETQAGADLGPARHLLIEAHGPGLDGQPVRLIKLEAVVYPAGTPADKVYEKIVAREFEGLAKVADTVQDKPSLSHGSAISDEDRRRYARILGIERGITACAWQAKIPRVMTEIIEHLKTHDAYQKETRSYYEGRADEAERREAIARYVQKEIKYRSITEPQAEARVNELAELTQQLYARQQTVFDPRLFVPGGPATKGSTPFILDLHLSEMRLRRGIHRFYTGARLKDQQVFMGEAMVTGQPLVTKEMANFLCEINHSFNTLRLFEYRPRG